MPRIKGLSMAQKTDYQKKVLTDHCVLLLQKNHIKKAQIAEAVGITPQAVSNQFSKNNLSTDVVIAIISMTNPEAEEVKNMMFVR